MVLEARNLTGGYEDLPIVKNIQIDLQSGEWLSLLGANGSGKSTLLKLMARILVPQQGVVILDGKAIHSQPANLVAQKLAILPQQQSMPMGMTVRQLVSLGRSPHQPWWQWDLDHESRAKVDRAIQLTQLETMLDRPIERLSGGERQRAFLALALAQEPKILLLDEPTTYLDLHYQLELLELLKSLNRQQELTIITVLHELNLAIRYSDRVALLKEGSIEAIGTPNQVINPPNLAKVFAIQAAILDTPVGMQICPLTPH
jgi:iron complex transport system ATP-binding protein